MSLIALVAFGLNQLEDAKLAYTSANESLINKVRPIFAVLVLGLFISLTPPAEANQVSMQLTGVSSGNPTLVVSDPSAGYVGATAIIDPYVANVNGASTLIWCVDPDHQVNIGDNWTANLSLPGGSLNNTYLNNATTYGELAWLVTQLQSASTSTVKQEIQAAIWSIADPGDFSYALAANAAFASAVNSFEASAASNVFTSGFEILTDTAGNKQEFIVITPEPATILLLGVGLLGLFFLSRKKFVNV